jgi:hypothetical protein
MERRWEGRLGTSAVVATVAEALHAGEAASHRDYFTASDKGGSRWTAERTPAACRMIEAFEHLQVKER